VIAYLDSSAAVKLLVEEADSPAVREVWNEAFQVVSSVVIYPEAAAAVARARRGRRLDEHAFRRARAELESIWGVMAKIPVSTALARQAGELARRHGLRGFDAVHLAAAGMMASPRLVFVTADRPLQTAAVREGLGIVRLSA